MMQEKKNLDAVAEKYKAEMMRIYLSDIMKMSEDSGVIKLS